MKNLLRSIYSFSFVLIISACSSDDSPSADQNALAVGTYQLVEVNVSPQQDVNEDGTPSTNMIDEMGCLTGTLTLNADKSWNLSFVNLNVTEITGGMLFLECGETTTGIGTWQLNNGVVTMVGGSETLNLTFSENRLTNSIGETLPDGLQSRVYERP